MAIRVCRTNGNIMYRSLPRKATLHLSMHIPSSCAHQYCSFQPHQPLRTPVPRPDGWYACVEGWGPGDGGWGWGDYSMEWHRTYHYCVTLAGDRPHLYIRLAPLEVSAASHHHTPLDKAISVLISRHQHRPIYSSHLHHLFFSVSCWNQINIISKWIGVLRSVEDTAAIPAQQLTTTSVSLCLASSLPSISSSSSCWRTKHQPTSHQ